MKQGRPFEELHALISQNASAREDYVIRLQSCHMETDSDGRSTWNIDGLGAFAATPVFHRDLAEYFGIQNAYYESMQQLAPALLDQNVNTWIANMDSWCDKEYQSRLLRTFSANESRSATARAMLSPSYLPLDDAEMLDELRPVLDKKGVQVESCEISDERTYIKLVTPRLKADVKVGDTVQAGVAISNSELGFGAIRVQQFLKRLVCLNGMVVPVEETQMRRTHLGKRQVTDGAFFRLFENEDRKAVSAAVWKSVHQTVENVLEGTSFQNLMERLQAADKTSSRAEPEKLMERVAARFKLAESERQAALMHYERDSEHSIWGIANAVTRTANDLESYERATELETVGGRIMQLSERDWESLVSAN